MRWEYGGFGMSMDLVDEKKEILGRWETDRGEERRIGRLKLKEMEGEKGKEWVDEVVSVAIAIVVYKLRRG